MKQNIFFRNCISCGKQIGYISENSFKEANKKLKPCISCSKKKDIPLTRFCPQCNCLLTYTNKGNRQSAEKKGTICLKCAFLKRNYNGENNPFYKKTHTEDSIKKMSEIASNRFYSDDKKDQARKQLAKVSNKRPVYDIWLEKYGLEEANNRLENLKIKQSNNSKGEKNGMFGKPTPQGSGNGWSGWYNGWFFRSLRELSYMINVLEKFNLKWKIPDKSFRIKYNDYMGQIRTYIPDFVVEETRLVEIKPKKLQNTPKVLAKRKAAEEFCKNNNMIYEIIDPDQLTNKELFDLYMCGKIKFLNKYDKKFKQYSLELK